MIYIDKKNSSQTVEAVQFTNSNSIHGIESAFGVRVEKNPDNGTIHIGTETLEHGDYAISTGFVVVGKTAAWFESRFSPVQQQLDLFMEWGGASA